jgi:hypothetical protein
MSNDTRTPWTKTQEGEDSILIRLAQRYAPGRLPAGVALSEATREQITAATAAGLRAARPYRVRS